MQRTEERPQPASSTDEFGFPHTSSRTRHLSMKQALQVLCDFGDHYAACLESGPCPPKLSEEMNALTAQLLERLTGKEPSHGDVYHVMPFGD